MRVKQARWIIIGALVTFFAIMIVSGPSTIGVSQEWTNGRYQFAGGTAPWALVYASVMIGLYALFVSNVTLELGQTLPGVFRRLVAFWLDFVLALSMLAPILGLLPAITEWSRTGVFAWNFVRTTPAAGDSLQITIELPLLCVALVLYFALPLILGKPSPGTCALGYQVIPDEGRTLSLENALFRTLLGFVAAGLWFLAPFISRDRRRGKFWLDRVFHTRAVILT